MTLYQFKLMPFDLHAHTTWEFGTLLGSRDEEEQNFALYRIDDFFAEITYHKEKNEITHVKSFVLDTPLEPYLEQIALSELTQSKGS